MCEPRNRDNGASDLWTLTAYIQSENRLTPGSAMILPAAFSVQVTCEHTLSLSEQSKGMTRMRGICKSAFVWHINAWLTSSVGNTHCVIYIAFEGEPQGVDIIHCFPFICLSDHLTGISPYSFARSVGGSFMCIGCGRVALLYTGQTA